MFNQIFRDHPASVDETYFEHLRFALTFAGSLFLAGAAALVHALVPCLCEKTASTIINKLHHRMNHRHNNEETVSQLDTIILPAE